MDGQKVFIQKIIICVLKYTCRLSKNEKSLKWNTDSGGMTESIAGYSIEECHSRTNKGILAVI